MPWWQIIAILIVTAVVVGIGIGLLSAALGFSSSWSAAGVGAAVGFLGVALVNRRRRDAGNTQ